MARIFVSLAALLIAATTDAGAAGAAADGTGVPAGAQAAHDAVVAATNAFSTDLYKQAVRSAPGNLVISPVSAAAVLALTWHGARGATAQQLGDALHLPQDHQLVADGFSALLSSFKSVPQSAFPGRNEPILRVANMLYARQGFRLKEDFRQTAVGHYGADAQEMDFARNAEGARRLINNWAEERTGGKIKELFAPGSPSRETLLVLVNAIYFKADWMKVFKPEQTKMKPFYLSSNSVIKVPTMHKFSEYTYARIADLEATALVLSYQGMTSRMRMVIVLPDSADGLPQLERLDWDVNKFPWERRTLNISIPKFRIEASHDLNEKLLQLGVRDLFTSKADLSGVGDHGMFVSKVVQKTFIEVNEQGTEAGAASGIEGVYFTLPPPRADFFADRPFLFFILKDNAILFMGRVVDPRDSGTS